LTDAKFGIHLFNYLFVEYTYARSPYEYCNNIESPPEKIIFLNEYGQLQEIGNPNYHQPFPSVYQETHFHSGPNDQFASYKSIRDFDLNQLPLDEDD